MYSRQLLSSKENVESTYELKCNFYNKYLVMRSDVMYYYERLMHVKQRHLHITFFRTSSFSIYIFIFTVLCYFANRFFLSEAVNTK